LKQVLSPIPIVPSKQNVRIPGAKAKTRVTAMQVEFYLRERHRIPTAQRQS